MDELFKKFLHGIDSYLYRNCPSEFRPHAQREICAITNKIYREKNSTTQLDAMDEMVWYLRDAFPKSRKNLQPLITIVEHGVMLVQEEQEV